MDKKKLFIVIILIAIGVIFQILIMDGLNLFKNNNNFELIDKNEPNNFILNKEQFTSLSVIELNNSAGNIFVEKSDNDINYINTIITVFHKDKIKAEKIRKTITVLFERKENKLKISVHSKRYPLNRIRINFNIKLSYKSMLIINNSNGIVKVLKIKSPIKITHTRGQIILTDIKEKIFIKEAMETDIIISNCSEIVANLVNTTTTISNISGNMELFSKGGKIKIHSINNNKNIKIESRQSRISLSNIKNKNIKIKISYEDLFIKNLSAINLDLYLKNSNLVIDPITDKNINKTTINAIDAKILLKYNKNITPKYIIDLNYGSIRGNIDKLKITKNKHSHQAISNTGSPQIIIKGEYTDLKIVKKNLSKYLFE